MARVPTDSEQLMLELVNRLRMDPQGEYARLVGAGAPADVLSAISFFGVNLAALQSQLNALAARAPLAWHSALADAAQAHNQAMIAADQQTHQAPGEPDLGTRVRAAGYNFNALGENVYAFASTVFQGHAGFVVDWGYDAEDFEGTQLKSNWKTLGDGIQDPAGHRISLMNASFTEIGIAVTLENNSATQVGPMVITQDLGSRSGYAAQFLGVVIDDRDGDNFYDVGEGMGAVTVTVAGAAGNFSTTSWASGGYQLAAPAGTYTITFSGGGLSQPVVKTATIGAANVKVDAKKADSAILPTEGADALFGTAGADVIAALGGDDKVSGLGGDDRLSGGEGNDILDGGTGSDAFDGGSGDDEVTYALEEQAVSIDLASGARGGAAVGDTYAGIERYTLTRFGDVFTGSAGIDRVSGGAGNDVLDGAGGADQLNGGTGDDRFVVDDGGDIVLEGAGEGIDTVTASISYTLPANVERLVLSGGAAAGTGNSLDNIITGNAGKNVLAGGAGNDLFNLGGGLDTVDGGDGFDTLVLGGRRSDYRPLAIDGSDYLLGPSGGARLANLEQVQFTDATVTVAAALSAKAAFDPLRYLASNPDLIRAFGADPVASRNHFLDFGSREGRAIASFDAVRYTASHGDLIRAFGTDQGRAVDHYVRAGFGEGRALNFDGMLYLASNRDLISAFGADPARATEHYVRNGFAEGRTLSFNPLLYLASNPDLSRAFGLNPAAGVDHYVRFGASEGRATSSFDPVAYLAANADLSRAFGLDPTAAAHHYVRSGVNEGRATSGFDALRYAASNSDLIAPFGNDPAGATLHFVRFGAREGRSATAFDPLQYGAAHTDLARIFGTDMPALTRHYLDFGFREGRATNGFDPVAYLLSSPDLAAAGIGTAGAFGHWLRNGADEMRVGDALFGREQAGHSLALGGRASDALGRSGDQDWFQIQLGAGQKVNLSLGSDAFDPSLALHDSLGRRVAFDTDSGPGDDAFLAFTAGAAGLYYLVVAGTGVGTYTLDAFPGA